MVLAITNNGGIALLTSNNTIVDEVGMDAGSAYQEGTTLPPFSGTSDQSYERKLGGASDSCVDTNDNASDFGSAGSATLHNYASPLSLCGVARPAPSISTTTITADNPDPSLVNGNISVSVKVTGGSAIPSGLVNITGANTNCTITLNSSGTGSCNVEIYIALAQKHLSQPILATIPMPAVRMVSHTWSRPLPWCVLLPVNQLLCLRLHWSGSTNSCRVPAMIGIMMA